MTHVLRTALVLALAASLAGCGGGFRPLGFLHRDRGASPVPPPAVAAETAEEEAAALAEAAEDGAPATSEADAPAATGTLGTTVASLGDPTRPGLWLETPLVHAETQGRLVTETGESVDVTLIPSGGAAGSGSRISIMAMQALGVGLTELPTLTVIAGG